MNKSPRHKLNKTDKHLLDALVAAGYEHEKARDLIQKHVYILPRADLYHVASEIRNGVSPTQAYTAVYQARRIRLARKYLEPEDGNEGGLTIIDFPGVGETLERDKEYYNLYKENVAELDLVVWVIKSDERAYAISQKVYNDILLPNIKKCPVVFFINQIDKIEPTEDDEGELLWDKKRNVPTKEQLASVNEKILEVSTAFSVPASYIIPTSVKRKFNISKAMETIIDILPKEKKYALYREAGEEIKTEKMAESAEKGVWDTIKEWTGEAWDNVKDVVVEVVAATVVAAGKKLLSKLKFW